MGVPFMGKTISETTREIEKLMALHRTNGCDGGKCGGGRMCGRLVKATNLQNKLNRDRDAMRNYYH